MGYVIISRKEFNVVLGKLCNRFKPKLISVSCVYNLFFKGRME